MKNIFASLIVLTVATAVLGHMWSTYRSSGPVQYVCADGSVSIGLPCLKRLKQTPVTLTTGETVTLTSQQTADGSWVFPAEEIVKLKPYFPSTEKTYFHQPQDEAGSVARAE